MEKKRNELNVDENLEIEAKIQCGSKFSFKVGGLGSLAMAICCLEGILGVSSELGYVSFCFFVS